MTIRELKAAIADVPDELGVTVRCAWEDDEPNGNCFNLVSVTVEDDHATGEDFAAFDCDQEFEADDPAEDAPKIVPQGRGSC